VHLSDLGVPCTFLENQSNSLKSLKESRAQLSAASTLVTFLPTMGDLSARHRDWLSK
jgi:pantothenate synthetase